MFITAKNIKPGKKFNRQGDRAKRKERKTMKQKFSFKDNFALFKLSMRSFFWRVDGNALINYYKLSTKIVAWVIIGVVMAFAVQTIVLLPFAIIQMLVKDGFFAAVSGTGKIFLRLIVFVLCFFNIERLRYCLRYKKTAWFQNTGFLPSQVASDVGLYGEFIATMCAEQHLEHHHIYGRIFNNVIIPKRDGDFNEIDLISVNETGIHVIEAKARNGEFYGSCTSPQWTQRCGNQEYTMQNPILQNLTHCNFLEEYLHEQLPDGIMDTHFYLKTWNVVLFTLLGVNANIDMSDLPGMSYFGMAESSLTQKNYRKTIFHDDRNTNHLNKAQINAISEILEQASSYSAAERQRMIADRTFKQEQRMFSHPVNYYVAKTRLADGQSADMLICRDNGFYKTYFDNTDKVFRAIPEIVVGERTPDCPDFRKVYTAYVKYLKEHPEVNAN